MADAIPSQPAPVTSDAPAQQKISWVMYDWANSGYGLIIIGPLFTNYFIDHLLPKDFGVSGSSMMGILNSISMAAMAIAAPVLGAIADIRGWTKRMLMLSASAGSILAMSMFLLRPGDWILGALLYFASNFCFGTSFAFSNAYLPHLTRPEKQGSLSGWGFAMGYIGGAIALIVAFRLPDPAGLALGGVWWLVFSIPAFLYLKELPAQGTARDHGSLALAGFRRVGHTFRNIRQYRNLFLFLLAFLLYNDGIETVISMSPSFGTEVLKMTRGELVNLFLIVQFVGFGGALAFGYLSDKLGNKMVILITLVVWIASSIGAFFVQSPNQFMMLGVVLGLVLGGVQASSRALMAELAPKAIQNEAFGFFSISGKFASIFGPLLYAGFAAIDPRWGVLSVPPFLVAGLIVLMYVPEPAKSSES